MMMMMMTMMIIKVHTFIKHGDQIQEDDDDNRRRLGGRPGGTWRRQMEAAVRMTSQRHEEGQKEAGPHVIYKRV